MKAHFAAELEQEKLSGTTDSIPPAWDDYCMNGVSPGFYQNGRKMFNISNADAQTGVYAITDFDDDDRIMNEEKVDRNGHGGLHLVDSESLSRNNLHQTHSGSSHSVSASLRFKISDEDECEFTEMEAFHPPSLPPSIYARKPMYALILAPIIENVNEVDCM
jgi:hypothetical protein